MKKKFVIMASIFALVSVTPIAAMSRSTEKKMQQLRDAIAEGDIKAIEALLAQGLRLDREDDVRPILAFAISSFGIMRSGVKIERAGAGAIQTGIGSEIIIPLLLDAGARIEAVNPSDALQFTPLMLAVQNGNRAAVRILLQAGANVNARNNSGHSVLSLAARKKTPDMLWTLFMRSHDNILPDYVKNVEAQLQQEAQDETLLEDRRVRAREAAKRLRQTYDSYRAHVARAGQETETYHVAREITAQGGEEGFTTDLARKLAEFNRPSDQDAVRLLRLHSESLIAKIEQLERLLVDLQEHGIAEQDQKDARWLAGQLGQTKKDVAVLLELSQQETMARNQLLAAEDEFVVYRNRIAGFEKTINAIQERMPKKGEKKSFFWSRFKKK